MTYWDSLFLTLNQIPSYNLENAFVFQFTWIDLNTLFSKMGTLMQIWKSSYMIVFM